MEMVSDHFFTHHTIQSTTQGSQHLLRRHPKKMNQHKETNIAAFHRHGHHPPTLDPPIQKHNMYVMMEKIYHFLSSSFYTLYIHAYIHTLSSVSRASMARPNGHNNSFSTSSTLTYPRTYKHYKNSLQINQN